MPLLDYPFLTWSFSRQFNTATWHHGNHSFYIKPLHWRNESVLFNLSKLWDTLSKVGRRWKWRLNCLYHRWNIFLFYLNLSWRTKQNISLKSLLFGVTLLLYNLYGVYIKPVLRECLEQSKILKWTYLPCIAFSSGNGAPWQ